MPNGNMMMRKARKMAVGRIYRRLREQGHTPETARNIIQNRHVTPNLNKKDTSGPPIVPVVPLGASQGDEANLNRNIKRNNPNNPGNPDNSDNPKKRSGSCSGGCGD